MYFLLCNFCISEWVEFRSSRPEVFCKKGVLKSLTKCTGKHLCHSLFFNKVIGLMPATLLKKRLRHRCFPVSNFYKHLFTQNTSGGCFCELSFLGFCHKLWSVAKVILFCCSLRRTKMMQKGFQSIESNEKQITQGICWWSYFKPLSKINFSVLYFHRQMRHELKRHKVRVVETMPRPPPLSL